MFFISLYQSRNENYENENGKNKLEIGLEPLGHLHTLTGVTFLEVVVVSPAPLGYAEEKIYDSSDGKKDVTYNEVLAVKNVTSADKLYIAPYVISEHAGNACNKYENAVDEVPPMFLPIQQAYTLSRYSLKLSFITYFSEF